MYAVIDSNVYVYRAIEDSEYHRISGELLNTLSKWITPTIVVHEVTWTLMELIGRKNTILYVKALLSHKKTEVIPVLKQDISWAIKNIENEKLSLTRYNDKIILSVIKRINAPLLTFDKQLISQATRIGVPVINPYLS